MPLNPPWRSPFQETLARAVRSRAAELGFGVAVSAFTVLYFANAWVADDVYITFRTIDNFVNGYGLRWNVIERVQSYTHPLWLLLCSAPYFVTHEVFYTVIVTSFVVCAAAFLIFRHAMVPSERWKAALLVLLALASKTFMDWTSSGLENPLSALWAITFVVLLVGRNADPHANTRSLLLVASLAYVTRQDTVLLYAPSLAYRLWINRHVIRTREVLTGILPALAWTVFSVIYYGFPVPNTAYAKALVRGVAFDSKLQQGMAYLLTTMLWDPFAMVVLLAFLYLAFRRSTGDRTAIALGVIAYTVYVVAVAASSSTMGLRFFSVPFIAVAATAVIAMEPPEGVIAGILALTFLAGAPLSPLHTIGCQWAPAQQPERARHSLIADMRMLACLGGSALADFQRNVTLPDHPWLRAGTAFRQSPIRVQFGGASGAMGMFGYAAGPEKIIVDPFGLTDPLMARLPVLSNRRWVPGEIPRLAPDGYLRSLETGTNQIVDPALHEYYDSLHLIVAGPVFSPLRWREILAMNLGRRDWLLRDDNALDTIKPAERKPTTKKGR